MLSRIGNKWLRWLAVLLLLLIAYLIARTVTYTLLVTANAALIMAATA